MKIVQPAFKVLPTGKATAALPVWAYFMKLCYADENLKVSKGEFERPANLSIRVDCYNAPAAKDTTATLQNTDEF
jgi:penicillin-binding protein 1A